MGEYSKAIGAAIGGGSAGASGGLVAALALLPPGSSPWAYVAVILGLSAISAVGAGWAAYQAPANKPS